MAAALTDPLREWTRCIVRVRCRPSRVRCSTPGSLYLPSAYTVRSPSAAPMAATAMDAARCSSPLAASAPDVMTTSSDGTTGTMESNATRTPITR